MRKQLLKVCSATALLITLLFSSLLSRGQTSLSYGDVLIVGWNNNLTAAGTADYQWVPMINLAPGTVIKFGATGFMSNAAANAASNARVTAGVTIWTNTTGATIQAGTVITNDNAGGTTLGTCSRLPNSCGCGAASTAYMVQSTSGGRFFVYDGGTSYSTSSDFAANTNPTTFNGSPVMLFGFQGSQTGYTNWLSTGTTGNFLTYLPSDLNGYSLFLGGNAIGGYYNGPRVNGNTAAFRAAVLNPANWTTVSGPSTTVTYPTGNFVFGLPLSFGGHTSLTVAHHSGANAINSNLTVSDTTSGLVDSIIIVNNPVHGTLAGFPYAAMSSGSFTIPSGLTYTPDTGYTGTDSFRVHVSNGITSTTARFIITVQARLAPTTLHYGDVLITGINNYSTTVQSYQWVPLVDLGAGTVIKFTNDGFISNSTANSSNNAFANAGGITVWTNTTGTTIPAGTVITNNAYGATTLGSCAPLPSSCGCGSGSGGYMTQSTSGGKVFIYSGGITNSTVTDYATTSTTTTFNGSPISILGLQGTQTWTSWLTSGSATNLMSWLPSDLSAHALFLGSSANGGVYTGPRTGGNAASYRAAILTPSNWSTVAGAHTATFNDTNFTFSTPGHAPAFASGTTQNLTFCDNDGARTLNPMLRVTDADTGNTITLSLATAPVHGTAVVAYTGTSTGGAISPIGLSYTPSAGFTGRDTFSVTASDGTSTVTTTIRVLVNPSPAIPAISGASYVCNGSSVTLSASPSGGLWGSFDAHASVTPTGGLLRGLIPGTAVIYYNSPYNAYSCRSQGVYTLAVLGTPVASTLAGASSLCPASTLIITPSVPGGTWNVNYPGIASVASGIVTGVAPGVATITYTVSNNCFSSSVTKPVTVMGTPVTPGLIGGVPYVCEGGATVAMTNSLAGGVWSMNNTAMATVSSSGIVTGISAGVDTVNYTYTNSCGIARSVNKPVTIRPLPNAGTISGISTIVRGTNSLLTVSATGGTWSSSNTSLATINSSGRMYAAAAGTDTISYTVTNTCGTAVTARSIIITAPRDGSGSGNETIISGDALMQVYPNPSSGIVMVELQSAEGTISIAVTDIAGRQVLNKTTNTAKTELDLGALPAGTYLLKAVNAGKRYTAKIMVQ